MDGLVGFSLDPYLIFFFVVVDVLHVCFIRNKGPGYCLLQASKEGNFKAIIVRD